MFMIRVIGGIVSAGIALLNGGAANAQAYPNKPIRVLANEPGGGGDFMAHIIAEGLTGILGQQVIVDNRGLRQHEIAAKSSPDGYTLTTGATNFWLGPLLQETRYDPVKDFLPVTLAVESPCILVVHPSVPAKTVKELIALAKAKPGALNYGMGAIGAMTHLAPELFKQMAGIDVVRIPYKGTGPTLIALIGGEIQLSFPTASTALPAMKTGKVRALAVTSAQTSTLAPGLPTMAAGGLQGYEASSLNGLFAPANTPARIINRLNIEIVRVLNKADIKERFFNSGVETIASSPEEFANRIKSEIVRMGKVIKDAGIRAE